MWEFLLLWCAVGLCAVLTAIDRGWENLGWGIAAGLLWPMGVGLGIGRVETEGGNPAAVAVAVATMTISLICCTGFRPAVLAWKFMEDDEVERPGFKWRVWGGWIGLTVGAIAGVIVALPMISPGG